MSRYQFFVTYDDKRFDRSDADGTRVQEIIVENEEIATEKLAFQYAVMKAYDKRYKYEGVFKIELCSVE